MIGVSVAVLVGFCLFFFIIFAASIEVLNFQKRWGLYNPGAFMDCIGKHQNHNRRQCAGDFKFRSWGMHAKGVKYLQEDFSLVLDPTRLPDLGILWHESIKDVIPGSKIIVFCSSNRSTYKKIWKSFFMFHKSKFKLAIETGSGCLTLDNFFSKNRELWQKIYVDVMYKIKQPYMVLLPRLLYVPKTWRSQAGAPPCLLRKSGIEHEKWTMASIMQLALNS